MEKFETDILNQRLILMCGISGTGKTFYSKKLEEKGFLRISSDEIIWERYGSKLFSLSEEEKAGIFGSINGILIEHAIPVLKAGKNVVIDSTMCKKHKRVQFKNNVSDLGITPLIFYIKPSLEIIKQRLKLRKGLNANDQIVTLKELERYFNNFEAPEKDENYIEIELGENII